jgi:hypothetical protein
MPSALEQSTIPPSNFFTHRESLAWVRNGYRPRHAQVGNDDHVLQASRKIGRSRYIRIYPVSVTPAGLLLQERTAASHTKRWHHASLMTSYNICQCRGMVSFQCQAYVQG